MRQENIVQAEFFHVGGPETKTLSALFREIGERRADKADFNLLGIDAGTGIKTVVRSYDREGLLTNFALRAQQARQKKDRLRDAYFKAGWLARFFRKFAWKRALSGFDGVQSQKLPLTVDALRLAVAGGSVAIELRDHRFRKAEPTELHELVESASAAKRVWLFIFKPNDLLADKNEMVAHVW